MAYECGLPQGSLAYIYDRMYIYTYISSTDTSFLFLFHAFSIVIVTCLSAFGER